MPEREAALRRELEKLLPFYVNGSLEADERERVALALEGDASLRAEIAFLEAVRDAIHATTEVPAAGELGLARLRRSVRAERRRALFARTWRPALALAAGLALVVQTALLLQRPDDAAHLAGGERADLQVSFASDASEDQIRTLLHSVGANIVDGPSATGLYRLELSPTPSDEADWVRILAAFSARPDIVTHVARE